MTAAAERARQAEMLRTEVDRFLIKLRAAGSRRPCRRGKNRLAKRQCDH